METHSEEEQEKRMKLRNGYKLLNEIIDRCKVLNKTTSKEKNKKNKDMHFIDFLDYFYHKTINRISGVCSAYDDDLVVKYHISPSDFYGEF